MSKKKSRPSPLRLFEANEARLKQILDGPQNTCGVGFATGQAPTNSSSVAHGNICIRATLDFPLNKRDSNEVSTDQYRDRMGPFSYATKQVMIDSEARLAITSDSTAASFLVCKGLDEIQRLHSFLSTYLAVVSRP